MARLPPLDVRAHWIRDALHRGDRPRALAMIDEAIASGKAGAETRALAEYLRTAKRGRPPFGAKHLWYEIGLDNDEMREAGKSGEERYAAIALKYRMNDISKIKTAIAKYERAMDEVRAIDQENRDT